MLYPVELQAHRLVSPGKRRPIGAVVGVNGFEPLTFCSQSRRATRLRHTPPRAEPAGGMITLAGVWEVGTTSLPGILPGYVAGSA